MNVKIDRTNKIIEIEGRLEKMIRFRGLTGWGIIQAIAGAFLMFYGLGYMICKDFISGITIVGVGMAVASFAITDRFQGQIMKRLDEIERKGK